MVRQLLVAPVDAAMASASSALVVTKVIVSTFGYVLAISGSIDSMKLSIEQRPYPHAKHAAAIFRHEAAAS